MCVLINIGMKSCILLLTPFYIFGRGHGVMCFLLLCFPWHLGIVWLQQEDPFQNYSEFLPSTFYCWAPRLHPLRINKRKSGKGELISLGVTMNGPNTICPQSTILQCELCIGCQKDTWIFFGPFCLISDIWFFVPPLNEFILVSLCTLSHMLLKTLLQMEPRGTGPVSKAVLND